MPGITNGLYIWYKIKSIGGVAWSLVLKSFETATLARRNEYPGQLAMSTMCGKRETNIYVLCPDLKFYL